jgi:hypothetical protein
VAEHLVSRRPIVIDMTRRTAIALSKQHAVERTTRHALKVALVP